MKIENYVINMSSSHSYAEAKTSEEKLRYWNGNDRVEFEKKENSVMLTQNNMDSLEISKEALKLQEKNAVKEKVELSIENTNNDKSIQLTISEKDKQKIRLIEDFITRPGSSWCIYTTFQKSFSYNDKRSRTMGL